jgi:hypothetical protein
MLGGIKNNVSRSYETKLSAMPERSILRVSNLRKSVKLLA